MSSEAQHSDWRRVDALFAAALAWSPDERAARLRDACEGDERLFRAVSELLEASSASEEFLSRPPTVPPEALDRIEVAVERDLTGERIGRYRVLRKLGRGGMATVWLAERADGAFRRAVALKVLRRGLDTADVLARFRAERQILSSLEHPNIARLYDAGSTEDGRPFLALEYVEGEPIDAWCDARGSSVDERLEIFLEIGRAVQFAHARLVVHRDIKPSNILVTGDGSPKLLDFGIAKLLDPEQGDDSHRTRTGLQPLTLRYASPEQVRGEPVTTASDVYQLGHLLYRLLTGAWPFPSERDSREEIREAILATPARRPSAAARRAESETALARRATPERLARRLSGDLDTILLKALAKDPEERYASAIELVEDVRRHLQGRPIAARRAGPGYRVRKYFRRNRWAAPALGAAALVIAGYVATVERHARQLERERNVAEAEAARATAVRNFLAGIFEGAEPNARGDEISARELLDRSADRIAEDLAGQPSVLAEMSVTVGTIYSWLGDHRESRVHLERAVRLLDAEPASPSRDERLALALARLANVTAGVDPDSGAALGARAYRIASRVESGSPDQALALLLSSPKALQADRDSLRAVRDQAIEILRRYPDRRADLATALQQAAYTAPDPDRSLALHREALGIRRELYGETHTSIAASLNDIAMMLDRREPGSADSLMLRAVEIDRELLGPAHTTTLTILNNYAWMLSERGELEEAVRVFGEVLEQREAAYPDERWKLAYPLHGLGVNLMALDRHAEAERALRETIRVLIENRESEDQLLVQLFTARGSLAKCLLAQGKLDESERLAWRTLEEVGGRPGYAWAAGDANEHLEAITRARSEAALR